MIISAFNVKHGRTIAFPYKASYSSLKVSRQLMLQTIFKDVNGCRLENDLQNAEDLSGGVLVVRLNRSCIRSINNHNPHNTRTEFLKLCAVLRRMEGNKKLQTIEIKDPISLVSPEYLAFLIAACSKAHEVKLNSPLSLSDSICTCFLSSMMGPDSIRELSISFTRGRVSMHQARLLFQGVELSSSLEKLELVLDFEDMEDSGMALGRALDQNQSLKVFSLQSRSLHSDTVLANVVTAAATSASIETLIINAPHSIRHGVRRLSLSVLQDCLCRVGCSLRELTLENIVLEDDLEDSDTLRNSSVATLKLRSRASLTCSQTVRFVNLFSSLEHLDIDFKPMSELTSLNEFLQEDGSTLQSLKLFVAHTTEMDEEWKGLFQKLPRMKSLRNLDLPRDIFLSGSCKSALLNALRLNTSIERMNLFGGASRWESNQDDESFAKFYCIMSHFLCLNKGGRRFLQNQPLEQPLAGNLWPLVLERALEIDYVSDYDKSKHPELASLECDVVYWLLREKFFT